MIFQVYFLKVPVSFHEIRNPNVFFIEEDPLEKEVLAPYGRKTPSANIFPHGQSRIVQKNNWCISWVQFFNLDPHVHIVLAEKEKAICCYRILFHTWGIHYILNMHVEASCFIYLFLLFQSSTLTTKLQSYIKMIILSLMIFDW